MEESERKEEPASGILGKYRRLEKLVNTNSLRLQKTQTSREVLETHPEISDYSSKTTVSWIYE